MVLYGLERGQKGGTDGPGHPAPLPPPAVLPGPPAPEPPRIAVGPPEPQEEEEEVLGPAPEEPAPVVGPPRTRDKEHWADGLDGARLLYNPYEKKGYPNWTIDCGDPTHVRCFKTKGQLDTFCKSVGEIEPLCFLHAWRAMPWPGGPGVGRHSLRTPAPGDVAVWAERHEELKVIYETTVSKKS